MRLVVNEFENGTSWAVRTTTDGRSILETLKGHDESDASRDVYVEVACRDTDSSMEKLHNALCWAIAQVGKRRYDQTRAAS